MTIKMCHWKSNKTRVLTDGFEQMHTDISLSHHWVRQAYDLLHVNRQPGFSIVTKVVQQTKNLRSILDHCHDKHILSVEVHMYSSFPVFPQQQWWPTEGGKLGEIKYERANADILNDNKVSNLYFAFSHNLYMSPIISNADIPHILHSTSNCQSHRRYHHH